MLRPSVDPYLELESRRSWAFGSEKGRYQDRAPFVNGVLKALAHVTDVAEQLETPLCDYTALIQLLEQPEILAELRSCDPLAPARLRGLHFQTRLLDAEGGTGSAEQLA